MSQHGGILLRQLTNTSLIPIVLIWFRAFPRPIRQLPRLKWVLNGKEATRWTTGLQSWEASCATTRPTQWLVKSRKEILNWALWLSCYLCSDLTLALCHCLCTMHQTLQILSTFFLQNVRNLHLMYLCSEVLKHEWGWNKQTNPACTLDISEKILYKTDKKIVPLDPSLTRFQQICSDFRLGVILGAVAICEDYDSWHW